MLAYDAIESGPSAEHLAELPGASQRLLECLDEFEECWKRGVLHLPLACPEARAAIGPVVHAYATLRAPPMPEIVRWREVWMQNVIEEFTQALRAPSVTLRSTVQPDGLHAVQHEGRTYLLRQDQAIHARAWGVGLEPNDPAQAAIFAQAILHSAVKRLAGEIICVGKMCQALADRRVFPQSVRWVLSSHGRSFEHLTLDILNEDACRATGATLFEDLFEWTDLRVHYPNLPRRRGARVQVKFTASQRYAGTLHGRNISTHVVLSPVALAGYVEAMFEGRRQPGLEKGFWESLPAEPADSDELAASLFRLFRSAIETHVVHPLGPLVMVPPVVRRLVRRFVYDESFEAAMRMIDSLNSTPGAAHSWIKRF